MSKHTELPSETDGSETDFNLDAEPALARTPIRFGRLALWIASASALTIGVMGTVAYGVWFNQDQHAYAEAMEHARQTLWLAAPAPAPEPAPAAQQMASSDYVEAPAPVPPSRAVAIASASADMTAPVSSTQLDRPAALSYPVAPKLAVTHHVRGSCAANEEHHRPVSRVKSNGALFTRVGSFFHRVSYRQHGTESQRDIYAHP
ncbi:hypothetical protein AWB69_06685 [Caballeronia udeis]|uniref:Uncharacterized protein n=1 Tax=Caballeronia udeis TaxID=1232866 RepID=A0A158IUK4_9BURK|nr:hypothetical protein [Caballeronia udeis]SAL60334.1 hypothetical protein AWB69_06685 [Caballeronia udeis]